MNMAKQDIVNLFDLEVCACYFQKNYRQLHVIVIAHDGKFVTV